MEKNRISCRQIKILCVAVEREFNHLKVQKNNISPNKNQTHNPPSSRSDVCISSTLTCTKMNLQRDSSVYSEALMREAHVEEPHC